MSWIKCERRTLTTRYGDVAPTNKDRRDRALKLVCHLCGCIITLGGTLDLAAGSKTERMLAKGELAARRLPTPVILLQVDLLVDRVIVESAVVENCAAVCVDLSVARPPSPRPLSQARSRRIVGPVPSSQRSPRRQYAACGISARLGTAAPLTGFARRDAAVVRTTSRRDDRRKGEARRRQGRAR